MTNPMPETVTHNSVPLAACPPVPAAARPFRAPALLGLFAGALLVPLALTSCEKPPPPPPPPPPRRAAAPPPPEKVTIDGILQTMKADARVQFPQAAAPTDEALARAVISFADALARGDSDKLRPMLDPAGKTVLDNLLKTGGWGSSTGKTIEAVRVSEIVQTGETATVVLALQEPGVAYPLAWNVGNIGGNLVFIAATTPNVTRSRASDFDDPSALTEPAATAAPAGDLTSQVAGIFKRSCYECHGPQKQKGDLRLDNLPALASGNKNFPSAEALGKELIRRVTLPKTDEDAMPKKGERVAAQDVETIRKWLTSLGAGGGAGSGASGGGTESPSAPTAPPAKEQPPGTKKRNTPNGPVNVPSGPQPEQKPGG